MTKRNKVILGVLTITPLLGYGLLFLLVQIFSFKVSVEYMRDNWAVRYAVTLLLAVTALSGISLMIYYIIHTIKSASLPSLFKVIWVMVLFFFNMFAMPIYFYIYVWRERRQSQSIF